MGLFGKNISDGNWVECEKKHGFDFNKNPHGCPLCDLAQKNQVVERVISKPANLIAKPAKIKETEPGGPCINNETKAIGTHPWFNTLFSAKAACRVLENLRNQANEPSLQELLNACKEVFAETNLTQYRGFPKNVEVKPASLNRLALHFIQAYRHLGLLTIKMQGAVLEELPSRGWEKIKIMLTPAGSEFIKLPNKIFDEQKQTQKLTTEESAWFINYIKQIEKKGFGEYRLLKDFVTFLKTEPKRNEDLRAWFMEYAPFKQFISGNADKERARNLATTLAGSKLALLRELGVVDNARNNYTVIKDLP